MKGVYWENTQVPHRLPQSLECSLYICWATDDTNGNGDDDVDAYDDRNDSAITMVLMSVLVVRGGISGSGDDSNRSVTIIMMVWWRCQYAVLMLVIITTKKTIIKCKESIFFKLKIKFTNIVS